MATATTTRAHWSTKLPADACGEAVTWARTQPSANTAWTTCERPDWMLWLLGRLVKTDDDRKAIVLVACACARTSLKYVKAGETRPLKAIETAEAWCRGETTIEQVREARYAADAASSAAASASAYASAYAASAAAAASAYASAYAAAADADAAYDAAADAADARSKARNEMADIVRAMVPMPRPWEEGMTMATATANVSSELTVPSRTSLFVSPLQGRL